MKQTVICMVRTFLYPKTITVIMASPKRKLSCRKSFGKLNIFFWPMNFYFKYYKLLWANENIPNSR
jgi:hypothetical protein